MSLRAKILLILLVIIALYASLDYGIQRLIVFPSFINLEREEAEEDMGRCINAIQREIHHLDLLCQDWGAWDETYQFVADKNNNFLESNLIRETFTGNKLNLVYIFNSNFEVVWGEIYDLETNQRITVKEFSKDIFTNTHPLLKHKDVESSISGIMMTEKGPMFIASRPIITGDRQGPIRGTIMMGRFFNKAILDTLIEQIHVTFRFWSIKKDTIPAYDEDALNQLKPDSAFLVKEYSSELLYVYTTYSGMQNTPILLLRADIPRAITAKGKIALRFAFLSIMVAGLLILFVLFFILQKIVISPIRKLTAHMISIGKSDDLSVRLSLKRRDEIGRLAQEFNSMVEKLGKAQKKLAELSYHSGMAEMAAGILHNIRNAISPITIYIDDLRQRVRKIPLEEIKLARQELIKGNPPEERRRDLTQFLDLADKNLSISINETSDKLVEMGNRIGQIEIMLSEQDKLSHFEKPIEKLKLDELIRDSIAYTERFQTVPYNQRENIVFNIHPAIQKMEPISGNRMSLLQVFQNVLINAVESIQRAGKVHGEVIIKAEEEQVDNVKGMHIKISDNGEGIEIDELVRIFTTKREGSSETSLSWCANTMTAMNGRIYAESDGKEHGTTIHIIFPQNT